MKNKIQKIFAESRTVQEDTFSQNATAIENAVNEIVKTIEHGGKVLIFGNGGSAADSQHMAAELLGRFQKERKALPAIALTTDTSILTALGNDYSFDIIFRRQLEGLGREGDIAVGISTSGNSRNVIEAIMLAKQMGMKTIVLSGHDGGKLASLAEIKIIVPSKVTARIQESHECVIHAICELAEARLA